MMRARLWSHPDFVTGFRDGGDSTQILGVLDIAQLL